MAGIKAIETKHNGFRFRSRLEARWALFFEGLDIRYDYEPQAMRLSTGQGYLPDFAIPGCTLHSERSEAIYCEVKAIGGNTSKPLALADSGATVAVLDGAPDARRMYWVCVDGTWLPRYWTTSFYETSDGSTRLWAVLKSIADEMPEVRDQHDARELERLRDVQWRRENDPLFSLDRNSNWNARRAKALSEYYIESPNVSVCVAADMCREHRFDW